MSFKKKILANGLAVIGEVNHGAASAAVGVFVKAGSRDEGEDPVGIAHLVHRLVYHGYQRSTCGDVSAGFDRIGAQFNSFVSEEHTVYYAAVLPEYLIEATQLWIEVMSPRFRDDLLDNEKHVTKEEIAMYRDTLSFEVLDRCRGLHFGRHPCGRRVLGSEGTVESITLKQVEAFFASHYVPENVVFACVGDVDWGYFLDTVETRCAGWRPGCATRETQHVGGSQKTEHVRHAGLLSEHICLMSSSVSAQDPRRFAASLLAMILGDAMGSRFYWELVDTGYAQEATTQFSPMDGTGFMYTYVRCVCDRRRTVLETAKHVFDDLERHGVTSDELRRAKNKVTSALTLKNESPMGRLIDLGFNWGYLGTYRTTADDMRDVERVTPGDISGLIADRRLTQYTQFSIGGGDDGYVD
jgi:predicted Zn-dependent peptidase